MSIFTENRRIIKAWKSALGTYTYYGLLFLSYGELSSFAICLRYPEGSSSFGVGIAISFVFLGLLILYCVGSVKYPLSFGSFKNKFYKFGITQYVYIFFTA